MKMIPTANKMINCEQWESLQSSAVEANLGQGWVCVTFFYGAIIKSNPSHCCNLHSTFEVALHCIMQRTSRVVKSKQSYQQQLQQQLPNKAIPAKDD